MLALQAGSKRAAEEPVKQEKASKKQAVEAAQQQQQQKEQLQQQLKEQKAAQLKEQKAANGSAAGEVKTNKKSVRRWVLIKYPVTCCVRLAQAKAAGRGGKGSDIRRAVEIGCAWWMMAGSSRNRGKCACQCNAGVVGACSHPPSSTARSCSHPARMQPARAPHTPARWENGFEIEDLKFGQPNGKLAKAGKKVQVRMTVKAA